MLNIRQLLHHYDINNFNVSLKVTHEIEAKFIPL